MKNMLIQLILLHLFLVGIQAKRSHHTDANYVHCDEDNDFKYDTLSVPGKQLICHSNLTKNDVIQRKSWKRQDEKSIIQFASVQGSLHCKLTHLYPYINTIVVYDSNVTDFALTFKSPEATLMIISSSFPIITNDSFKHAANLRHLGFYSNNDMEFEEECFSNLNHLRNLTVYHQDFPELKDSFLVGLVKLKRLVIVNTGLHTIEEEALSHTHYLRELILDYNPLKKLEANRISSLSHLRKISLVETGLKKLYLPIFSPLRRLEVVDLSARAWADISVTQLALAFPQLKTIGVEKEMALNENEEDLIQRFKFYGLEVVITNNSKDATSDEVYEEDVIFALAEI